MCNKKLIFRRLLEKLVSDSVFSANNRLIKQVDGCPIGGSFSGIFAGIYMTKLENDVVKPIKPIFYRRYVDDIYSIRKIGEPDFLLEALNNYHPNMHFTIEENPKRFFDAEIIWDESGKCTTKVFQKQNKLPNVWQSKIPKRYKRNAIKTDLHRAKRISSDFPAEIKIIQKKYLKANFPVRFINSVIKNFNEPDDDMIIPEFLFNEKTDIYVRIPFCEKNEKSMPKFLETLEKFTRYKFKINIVWITRNIKSLFPLKDRVHHSSKGVYQGVCSCGRKYIGETLRNYSIRWEEHEDLTKDSEVARHVKYNLGHKMEWTVLVKGLKNTKIRKIFEAFYIAKFRPSLNGQVKHQNLTLFRNGIT